MNFWRAAGLNYVQYSNIAACLVRKSLKPQLQADALKRDVVNIKFTKWEAGKASVLWPRKPTKDLRDVVHSHC